MRLSQAQMDALKSAAGQDFEDRLLAHCQAYFPIQCQALGEEATRQAIRDGVARARHYGFKSERHLCQYVNLVFTYGDNFDTNAALGWPQEILHDEKTHDPAERMSRLCDAGWEHLDRLRGV